MFSDDIQKFNTMYKLPRPDKPTLKLKDLGCTAYAQLTNFKQTLQDELEEVEEILLKIEAFTTGMPYLPPVAEAPSYYVDENEILTDIADWLADIQIYCASEMVKFGIPWNETLSIIMESNFSKEFDDGPHYDERGKVLKGPNYQKPEPMLREMIEQLITEKEESK